MAMSRTRWIVGGLVVALAALAAVLAIVLVTDDDTDGTATSDSTVEQPGGDASTGTTATTGATTTDQPSTTAAPAQSFVCPEGGMAAAEELQSAVDEGHQPWRLSPEDVAASCAFGSIGADVVAAGPDTYRVTDEATGEAFIVEVAQPVRQGSGGIWVVTAMTPAG